MIDKIYLDASFFVALQIKEHIFYQKAWKKINKSQSIKIYFSLFTLDEAIHVLKKYKLSKSKIIKIVKDKLINTNKSILISYKDDKKTSLKYLNLWQKYNLRPIDSVHLFLMKQHKIKTIATFDNDFIKNKKQPGIKVL
ncbi:type II toxin-antitoxin system VapC family toxin [Patescibacteria group bacterium]|nr:type II toxin-antitoxin system VapC family toxin [Patescibacteria group bacterium]